MHGHSPEPEHLEHRFSGGSRCVRRRYLGGQCGILGRTQRDILRKATGRDQHAALRPDVNRLALADVTVVVVPRDEPDANDTACVVQHEFLELGSIACCNPECLALTVQRLRDAGAAADRRLVGARHAMATKLLKIGMELCTGVLAHLQRLCRVAGDMPQQALVCDAPPGEQLIRHHLLDRVLDALFNLQRRSRRGEQATVDCRVAPEIGHFFKYRDSVEALLPRLDACREPGETRADDDEFVGLVPLRLRGFRSAGKSGTHQAGNTRHADALYESSSTLIVMLLCHDTLLLVESLVTGTLQSFQPATLARCLQAIVVRSPGIRGTNSGIAEIAGYRSRCSCKTPIDHALRAVNRIQYEASAFALPVTLVNRNT